MINTKDISIKIIQGEEYKIRLGSIYERDGIFHNYYCQAAKILRETIQNAETIRRKDNEYNESISVTDSDSYYEFSNNIIAFCGGRGEGKSSALRTFSNALECMNKFECRSEHEKFSDVWGEGIEKYRFTILPVIDPTMMKDQDSFMRIILSRMFSQFNQSFERKYNGIRGKNDIKNDLPALRETQEKILKNFWECYGYLNTINKKSTLDSEEDDLEKIAELGDSGNMKTKFRELVQNYLNFVSNDAAPNLMNRYLILQIDDADLSFQRTFEIFEDIRSFCMVPEVIILLAVDIKQLYLILEQHQVNDFEILLKYRGLTQEENPINLSDCRKMAIKYIDKVLPGSRRIYLPQIDSVLKNELDNLTIQYLSTKKNGTNWDILSIHKDANADYQDKLLVWMNRKTGLVLVKPRYYRHNILPGHFRELTHFLAYFDKLEDINQADYNWKNHLASLYFRSNEPNAPTLNEKIEEIRNTWLGNLQLFEQYFIRNWAELHLNREGKELLLSLADAPETMKITLIDAGCDRLSKQLNIDVLDESINLGKNTFGYMMNKISIISQWARRDEDFSLLYALRLYYTIFVYKRFLLLVGDKDSSKHFIEENGLFSTWMPAFQGQNLTNSLFRFEVSLPALCTLREEFSAKGGEQNQFDTISSLFYVIYGDSTNAISYPIRKEDIKYIINKKTYIDNENIHVIFDFGYVLLTAVLEGRHLFYDLSGVEFPNDQKIKQEVMENISDFILQILFNWDVQHYLDKSGITLENAGNSDMIDLHVWISNLLRNTIQKMGVDFCLKETHSVEYLYTIVEKSKNSARDYIFEEILGQMLPDGLSVVTFGNRKLLYNNVTNYLHRLHDAEKKIYSSGNDDGKLVNIKNLVDIIQSEQHELYSCLPIQKLKELRNIIRDEWDMLQEKVGEFSDIVKFYEEMRDEISALILHCRTLVLKLEDEFNEEKLNKIFIR